MIDVKFTTNDVVNSKLLEIGDYVYCKEGESELGRKFVRLYEGGVVECHQFYYVIECYVDSGWFRRAINKIDILIGDVKISKEPFE